MPAMNPVDLDRLFGEALNAGDVEGLLALYEPNASFTPEPGAELHGHDAIRGALEGFISMKPNATLDSKTIAQIDDIALTTSNWTLSGTGPDGPVELAGHSVEVSRKQSDGSWLFIMDNVFGLEWD